MEGNSSMSGDGIDPEMGAEMPAHITCIQCSRTVKVIASKKKNSLGMPMDLLYDSHLIPGTKTRCRISGKKIAK